MNELLEQAILDKRLLEELILSFYNKINSYPIHLAKDNLIDDYKNHFNIEVNKQGYITKEMLNNGK